MQQTRIAVLGAGPAGAGAAWRLAVEKKAEVTVIEKGPVPGGNAGSFELAGLNVDYGSHRLHPACDPRILDDLKTLLGDELLDRPRHGRIRLQGRWIHFPLKPQDLALKLPLRFSTGVAGDALRKVIPLSLANDGKETFTGVLEKGLGATICRDFYFPYARKIWGLPPEELSAIQAKKRVAAGSLGKMVRKALSLVPGLKPKGAGRFYYPKRGYGQITTALAGEASRLGVDFRYGTAAEAQELGDPHRVRFSSADGDGFVEADYVWSTIPLSVLAKIVRPAPPAEVIEAAESISYRAMILIYTVLEQDRWTEFDAHYFPEEEIPLTRLSEPKNYSASEEPRGRTVLCGELPCSVGDDMWNASDEELGTILKDSLERCGLPVSSKVVQTETRRLPFAYPIYKTGYEAHFEALDRWASGLERVLTFGRQGLFAHDNTHHALAMSYAAVECLGKDGSFDDERWNMYRREFEEHVVED
ncbi:MAG: FAD-dependent oxidoreductase [Acidobacteriota bacterium]|nr:MAG: FAD-dependent oxidoreductase [Acidobacteriota bacterium]